MTTNITVNTAESENQNHSDSWFKKFLLKMKTTLAPRPCNYVPREEHPRRRYSEHHHMIHRL